MTDETMRAELLPCPFCGGGETIFADQGRVWTGMRYSAPIAIAVRHWCEKIPGQPSRMIERIGRDRESAIAAWNMRAERTRCAEIARSMGRHEGPDYRRACDEIAEEIERET